MAELTPKREVHGGRAAEYVHALMRGLGRFERSERPSAQDRRGRTPVLIQHLDAEQFAVSFPPGSRVYGVLANDQNRFAPPRSLPPILEFAPASGDVREHCIVRYAWSAGAFKLLDSLLLDGHAFDTFEFVELTWQLAQALRFLHANGVVQGQWNARSVVALPEGAGLNRLSQHRFELLNTGVVFLDPAAVPEDYIARGYYPPELFAVRADLPDLGALDATGDVYCFAAFLKDLLQRACSTEELPRRATRLMGALHEHAVRQGWRVGAEETRRKELEILDHLYTARARTEYLIQEGLRQRDQRASAETIARKAEALHRQVTAYLGHLYDRGYEPFDAFDGSGGDGLLHYTTFAVTLSHQRVHGLEDNRIEIRGRDLPHDLVRVTLNERSEGIRVVDASPTRIVLDLEAGLPGGSYAVSINNRRTNASLEVVATEWLDLSAGPLHLPWEGCEPAEVTVRGWQLPRNVSWSLCPLASESSGSPGPEALSIVNLLALGGARDGGRPGDEIEACPTQVGALRDQGSDGDAAARSANRLEQVRLRLPRTLSPGHYQLRANFLATRLTLELLPALPTPTVRDGALSESTIRNHRAVKLTLTGQDLHPDMLVDLGDGLEFDAVEVLSPTQAELLVPAGFAPGDYRLRINRADTEVRLRVEAPQWHDAGLCTVRFARGQVEPAVLELVGNALPPAEVGEHGYALVDARLRPVRSGALAAEVATTEADRAAGVDRHRLSLAAEIRRGRRRLLFAGAPTGVEVRVQKPMPRAAQAAALAGALAALVWGAFAVVDHYRPEIDELRTPAVFAVRPGALELTGRNIQSIELWSAAAVAAGGADGSPVGGAPAATLPATAADDGAFRVVLPDLLPVGEYRLRPLGPVASEISRHVLTVRDPELRLQPLVAHRFDTTTFRLTAANGFDVGSFRQIELVPLDRTRPARTLRVEAGQFALHPADLDAGAVGGYAVRLDSLAPDAPPLAALRIEIVGPRLLAQPEGPVVPGAGERITLQLQIADRGAATWTGLVPADGASPRLALAAVPRSAAPKGRAAEATARSDRDGASPAPAGEAAPEELAGFAASNVPPGRYRVAVGLDEAHADAIGRPFEVQPQPRVVAIVPARVAPGTPERVVVEGVNLSAVAALVVRPFESSPAATDIAPVPIDPASVAPLANGEIADAPAGFAQQVEATLTLPSGRFAIAAAGHADAGSAELAVYDDCRRILASYRRGECGPEELLTALRTERPADDVLFDAAGLLFDRGSFAAAAALYAARGDAQSRFRRAFVAAFVTGQPVEALPADAFADAPGYAAAARSIGWTVTTGPVVWPEGALPWDVMFVRAHDEASPAAARGMLTRAEQLRVEAAAPVVPSPFAPFDHLRAQLLYREIVAGLVTNASATGERIRRELLADEAVWAQLDPPQRTEALFWSGHAACFYAGDDALALEQLRRAAAGTGPAADWATVYRRALGDDVPDSAGDGSWPARFAAVLGEFRHVRGNPNYDLLADPSARARSLDPATVDRARALTRRIELLEAAKPLDPFAHCALLYDIRAAQAATWPQEHDRDACAASRRALESLAIASELEPQRRFHLAAADVEPLTLAQIVVQPKADLRRRIDELEQLAADRVLTEPLRQRAAELAHRLSLPSVVWGTYKQQKKP